MKLLAIDTTADACSIAVDVGDGRPAFSNSELVGRGHAERLFGMMAATMDAAGAAFADLDRIAVTTGPGSFTGVRVGVAAARGLALVVECPIIGISTLAVHAAAARGEVGAVPVLAVIDARRDEVYGQRFAADGQPVGNPQAAGADVFASILESGDVLAGAAADLVVRALNGSTAKVVHRQSVPDICALAELGVQAAVGGEAPRPLYLRPPDAKPQLNRGTVRR